MNWTVLHTYELPDYVLYILNFTSQKWLDETFSDRPIWWHYLCISVPKKLTRPKSAFLLIDGGHNTDGLPKPEDNFVTLTSMFAVSTGSIGVDLQDIANQPIRFWADMRNRSLTEDALLGWTWKAYIDDPSNPNVLLHMPVTKAIVRAMDAVQQFVAQLKIAVPETFSIGGASKHGWATWTTAAVDNKRVIAAMPIVMNTINFQINLHHHYRSLVGWTFAFQDYYDVGITHYVDTTNFTKMSQIIDPYNYLDRFTQMKILSLQTAGDEFFLLDGEFSFWNTMQTATAALLLR
jgi:PhoPQ-activated pathogenicity-related protein